MEGNFGKIKIRYGMWIKKNESSVFLKKQRDMFISHTLRIIQEYNCQICTLKKYFWKSNDYACTIVETKTKQSENNIKV